MNEVLCQTIDDGHWNIKLTIDLNYQLIKFYFTLIKSTSSFREKSKKYLCDKKHEIFANNHRDDHIIHHTKAINNKILYLTIGQ